MDRMNTIGTRQQDHPEVEVHANDRGDEEHERDLEQGDGRRPDRLAEDDPGPAQGRHQDLAQEAELAVPDHRHAGEQRGRQHAHGDDPGVHELDEVHARRHRADEVAEAGPEDDQEDERLGDEPTIRDRSFTNRNSSR